MMLGDTTLPGAKFGQIASSSKQVIHSYDWSDECSVTDMGHGPTTITITGRVATLQERIDIAAACESARTVETHLYFPSEMGESDDHYYRVQTGPARFTPFTATIYDYEFTAVALVPWVYDADTGERVT